MRAFDRTAVKQAVLDTASEATAQHRRFQAGDRIAAPP